MLLILFNYCIISIYHISGPFKSPTIPIYTRLTDDIWLIKIVLIDNIIEICQTLRRLYLGWT